MNLPDNIQYIIERVADGKGNLPEVIEEAKMVLEKQGRHESMKEINIGATHKYPIMVNVPNDSL